MCVESISKILTTTNGASFSKWFVLVCMVFSCFTSCHCSYKTILNLNLTVLSLEIAFPSVLCLLGKSISIVIAGLSKLGVFVTLLLSTGGYLHPSLYLEIYIDVYMCTNVYVYETYRYIYKCVYTHRHTILESWLLTANAKYITLFSNVFPRR